MNDYEREALRRLRAWHAEPPGVAARLLARPGKALAQAVQAVVPEAALRAALSGADSLGHRLADQRSILKSAGAADLAELRARPLRQLDALARTVARRAAILGGAAGALFGVAGPVGLAADAPALLVLAMRTIHRTGLCYGERASAGVERRLASGIFALVSAETLAEKTAALAALHGDHPPSLPNLARAIGMNLTRRMAPAGVPVLGIALGAAVNASYLADVAGASRRVFRARWLEQRHPGLKIR